MELNASERMLLETLQEKNAEIQRAAEQRMMRFLTIVSERVGVPVDSLRVNAETGEIADARITEASSENGHSGEGIEDVHVLDVVR